MRSFPLQVILSLYPIDATRLVEKFGIQCHNPLNVGTGQ
jgi:hypothetical protein